MKITRLPILLLIVIGCAGDKDEPTVGIIYLNSILDLMEKNSMNRKTIDWVAFRADALSKANGAQSITDVYPAITAALKGLGDHHSFYSSSGGTTYLFGDTPVCNGSASEVGTPGNIGYINIPGFSGDNPDNFAKLLQDIIKSRDSDEISRWIVDLRGNSGGNMWPMLAGVGPILGTGTCGYFIDPDGHEHTYGYEIGRSVTDGQVASSVNPSYILKNNNPKVAVLLDQGTASSGEAIAISFIGRPNTRSFGVATCGLSTANAGFKLSDGAWLYLTTMVMADRSKNKKGGPIVPDVTVSGDQEMESQAIEWLLQE